MKKSEMRDLKIWKGWRIKTDCDCTKPDWVTMVGTREMSRKDYYYIFCDVCKRFAYNTNTGKKIVVCTTQDDMGELHTRRIYHREWREGKDHE
jgi:hypothetical protein